jgi:hypothetical protein
VGIKTPNLAIGASQILPVTPTKGEEYPNMRVVDFRVKERKSISLGVYYLGYIKTH